MWDFMRLMEVMLENCLKSHKLRLLINKALVELDLLTAERREGHGDCVAKHSKREYLDMNMSKRIPWGNQ